MPNSKPSSPPLSALREAVLEAVLQGRGYVWQDLSIGQRFRVFNQKDQLVMTYTATRLLAGRAA